MATCPLVARMAEEVQPEQERNEEKHPDLSPPSSIRSQLLKPIAFIEEESDSVSSWEECQRSGEGLPWWLSGKESACQCRRHGYDP